MQEESGVPLNSLEIDSTQNITFDDVLSSKLGTEKFHTKPLRLTFFCFILTDAFCFFSLNFGMFPDPDDLYYYDEKKDKPFFPFFAYYEYVMLLGVFISPIIFSIACDKLGRKKTMYLMSLLQTIIAVLTILSFILSINYLLIFLLIAYSLILGNSIMIAIIYVSEIMPMNIRGRELSLLSIGFIFQEAIYEIFLLLIVIPGLFSALYILPIISAMFIKNLLIESPRYLLSIGKIEKAFKNMNKLRINPHKQMPITQDEVEKLKVWSEVVFKKYKQINCFKKVKKLFSCKHFKFTLVLWTLWVLLMLSRETINSRFSDPANSFVFIRTRPGIISNLYFFEIAATIFAYFVLEENVFGSSKYLFMGFILLGISFFCVILFFDFIFNIYILQVFIGLSKFLTQFNLAVIMAYLPGVFKTPLRSTAISSIFFIGRISVIFKHLVLIHNRFFGDRIIFIIFALFSFLGAFLAKFTLPKTIGNQLDSS